MKEIVIPDAELWDENTQTFINVKGTILQLEHSLISISKWESKWHKPFISEKPKTEEELIDYFYCMSLNKKVDPDIFRYMPAHIIKEIDDYINDPMTATVFKDKGKKGKKEIITSEKIYYWMISLNIPSEYEKWHLNRLLALIHLCSVKNAPPKKMSKQEIFQRNRDLNAARREALHSKG